MSTSVRKVVTSLGEAVEKKDKIRAWKNIRIINYGLTVRRGSLSFDEITKIVEAFERAQIIASQDPILAKELYETSQNLLSYLRRRGVEFVRAEGTDAMARHRALNTRLTELIEELERELTETGWFLTERACGEVSSAAE